MTKQIQVKDATYERLNNGKFNNSFSEIIDKIMTERNNLLREVGLLKQEIQLLKLRNGDKHE